MTSRPPFAVMQDAQPECCDDDCAKKHAVASASERFVGALTKEGHRNVIEISDALDALIAAVKARRGIGA